MRNCGRADSHLVIFISESSFSVSLAAAYFIEMMVL